MKEAIGGIEPALLWEHFYEISQIPRCSKDEERVRQYVVSVAERNGLTYKMDAVKSVVVRKPATPGHENAPPVVLQSHLDMVCEKNKDTGHDFNKDPLRLVRDGDWLKAKGTTLGADNGIGVAASLAVLESSGLSHGPLEFLFTIDEETGLTGAIQLGDDMLEGRILLNMDSEEEGALYIGCAGGRDTEIFLRGKTESLPDGYRVVRLRVGGLQGGHSGLQIGEGLGNAVKLVGRLLWQACRNPQIRLAHIDGGSKHNAIPRECDAILALPAAELPKLKKMVAQYDAIYKAELKASDGDVFVRLDESGFDNPGYVFSGAFQSDVLNTLYVMPHGVLAMSKAVPGLVETSTNLAVVTTEGKEVRILTSQRSSVQSALDDVADMVTAVGRLTGARVEAHNGYPAWQPNPDSPLLGVAETVHQNIFGSKPAVKAIHAGLECGIIGHKFPGMDMISFGPNILGAHSPDERVEIPSVANFWKLLTALLEQLARRKKS